MNPWLGNFGGNAGDVDDIPPASGWAKWFTGVGVAAGLLAYGVMCVISRHGTLWGRYGGTMDVEGAKAVGLGIAWIGIGAFLHAHFFWGNIYYEYRAATIAKIAGLAAFVGGMGFVIARIVVGS